MWAGWMAMGPGDPFATTDYFEMVNNARAYAYARNAGIGWLQECTDCEEVAMVVPGGPDFISPILDPAPWYDIDNPDTWGFLGVIGLEVTGDESSTRQVTVTNTLQSGGIIGPPYFGPRTLVFRGILVAIDECSLQAGLDWLRKTTVQSEDPCHGDVLTFFECCPCGCTDDPGDASTPCWVKTYRELRTDPDACDPDWWPTTYAELIAGPPPTSEDWCTWPRIYLRLKFGEPEWSCCVAECVAPYLRQYHNVRVTEGPIVLSHPAMYSCGAMMEFEVTVVTADPTEYAMPGAQVSLLIGRGEPFDEGMGLMSLTADDDPFAIPGVTEARTATAVATRTLEAPAQRTSWLRTTAAAEPHPYGTMLSGRAVMIVLRSFADSGEVRLGLWRGGELLGGFWLPFVPAGSMVTIDGMARRTLAELNGTQRPLNGFVRGYDGGPLRWPTLGQGDFTVTVDQEPERATRIAVEVYTAATSTP